MNNTDAPGLAVMSNPHGAPETLARPSPRRTAANRSAWGSCEILLVADRVAGRRTGSTHKVYRDWRFAVVMHHGHPQTGTILFTIPVDPAHLSASQSRYALNQLANLRVMAVAGSAPFDAAGWIQDTTVPTHFTKSNPVMHVREETEMPSTDTSAQAIAFSGGASELGAPGSDHSFRWP
jgi:hypothetical protein